MLLSRVEKEGVIDALYESSNILSSTYNKEKKELKIVFKNSFQYLYEGVDVVDYHKFELADSQGVIFNKFIRQYPTQKMGAVDIEEFRTRIEEAKKEEIYQIDRSINSLCEQICREFENGGEIGSLNVTDLKRMIKLKEDKIKENNG
jgi:hypothetical protein